MPNLEPARRQMIEQQVRAWEVLDPKVLEVMAAVPRERFVPRDCVDLAFADLAVPLGHGQSMLPPRLEGRILQALGIQPSDRVLEIGTGGGYFSACLGRLGQSVRSIEIIAELAETARSNLSSSGARNVAVETGDAMQLSDETAYDVIALTGSLPVYDARFERALAIGGRMFAAVGPGPMMDARRITRSSREEWVTDSLFETYLDPLINAPRPPAFVF